MRVAGDETRDVGAFERFAFGWHTWRLDWRGGKVLYQDAPYLATTD